jgi:BirA family biotin operon repressor/biotin-[acetyl-CoA-carboxylase] ligase
VTHDLEQLRARLTTRWLGRHLEILAETVSTNDDAMARGRAGAVHGTVVIADTQARGRGRIGHRWFSPPGENLYLSVLLRTTLAPPKVPPITLAAGIAVADAVNSLGVATSLKWPNDVMVEHTPERGGTRKLAGILTEMSTRAGAAEQVVVGIGLNVNTRTFPDELARIATSLGRERGGEPLDRADVAARLCAALEHWFDIFLAGDLPTVARAWRARTTLVGRRVRVAGDGGIVDGVVTALDDDGALRLDCDGCVVRVVAGEIVPLAPAEATAHKGQGGSS